MTDDILKPLELLMPGFLDGLMGPYSSVAEANIKISNTIVGGRSYREGKTVAIGTIANYELYRWKGGFTDDKLVKAIDLSPYSFTVDGPLDNAYIDVNSWCVWAVNNGVQYPPAPAINVSYTQLDAKLKGVIDAQPIDDGISYLQSLKMDANSWVVDVVYIDNTKLAPIYQIKESDLPQVTKDKIYLDNGFTYLVDVKQDTNGWVISALQQDGGYWPPVNGNATSVASAVSTPEVWYNRYPNVLRKYPVFSKKFLAGVNATIADYVKIVIWGDSIMAREDHTSIGTVIPSEYPPSIVTQNFAAYLWQGLANCGLKVPKYRRYDYVPAGGVSPYTEFGVFENVTGGTGIDDEGDRPNVTRRSSTPLASLTFAADLTCNYFNLIDRTTTNADTAITISVSLGNGMVEVRLPGTSAWIEANGAVFSQRESGATSRKGETTYQRRVEFRKVDTAVAPAITLTKQNNSSPFYYWGLEMIFGSPKPYVQLINVARGSHTQAELNKYIQNDVTDRKPDLVLWEIPIINMYGVDKTKSYNVNQVWDTLFGDRPGAENTWSLKATSDNFTKFDVMPILPHIPQTQYNGDNTLKESSETGNTQLDVRNAIKEFLISRGHEVAVDMNAAFNREIQAKYNGKPYLALASSGVKGSTLMDDFTHQNDNGTGVYAKHITPIFDTVTY